MTHEDYVSYEQAKTLKELGFDWECRTYYEDYVDELNHHHRKLRFNAVANDMLYEDFCSAPTLAQAQKWLREVKNLLVQPIYDYFLRSWFINIGRKPYHIISTTRADFSSYEEALSAGIDRALEILKQEEYGNT